MAQTGAYYGDEEPLLRRYNSRSVGYQISHEGETQSATTNLGYERNIHNGSVNENCRREGSSDQDMSNRPRSRIPVACQRCRKRKIRCSGDSGGACTNCKAANMADQCQFLRVSSQDIPMKVDTNVSEYLEQVSVSNRHQGRFIPPAVQYLQTHSSNMAYDPYLYRQHPLPTYQQPHSSRNYYGGVSPYNEFDEQIEYGTQSTSYQFMPGHQIHESVPHPEFASPSQSRTWDHPTTQVPKTDNVYLEQSQQHYSHNQMAFADNTAYSVRGSISSTSSDPRPSSHSATMTLPVPMPSNDRILPFPAAHRPGPIGAFLRSNDGDFNPILGTSCQPHTGSDYSAVADLQSANDRAQSTVRETPYGVTGSNRSPDPLTYCDENQRTPIESQHQPLYISTNTSHYHTNSISESSYSHNARKDVNGSQHLAHDGLPRNSEGDLSSGYHYTPYNSGSASYPTPPMSIPSLPAAPVGTRKTSLQSIQ